jgi:hypothetical protein
MITTFQTSFGSKVGSIHVDPTGVKHFLKVGEAVLLANELLQSEAFYKKIAAHSHFDLADIDTETIAGMLRETQLKMSVALYYAFNSQTNIDGYDDPESPCQIHLNIWKINRSPASICNSIIHACVHAVNEYNKYFTFGHGDGSLHGKENTAPYWIGALAQQMVSKEESILLPMEHDPNPPVKKKQHANIAANQSFAQSMWITC